MKKVMESTVVPKVSSIGLWGWSTAKNLLVAAWLLGIIAGCSWVSLQLMTVFDVRADLEKLPTVSMQVPKIFKYIKNDVEPKDVETAAGEAIKIVQEYSNVPVPAVQIIRAIVASTLHGQDLQLEIEKLKFDLLDASCPENIHGPNKLDAWLEDLCIRIDEKERQIKFYDQLRFNLSRDTPAVSLYLAGLGFGSLAPREWMVAMPNMMLTLVVSLAMGAVGSSIRMMVELVKSEGASIDLRWYLFQPFLGALLAFTVFILIKSGHIAVSGGGAGSGGELNPYIIAFVGIVSGMLSEKAYRKIGVEGSKLFADDTTPRRVLPSVALAQLRKLGKRPDDLKSFFRTETDVIDLLRGNSTLHPDNQRLVAAWLNVSEGDLLTDGKPTVMERAVFEQLNTRTDTGTGGRGTDEEASGGQGTDEEVSGGQGAVESGEEEGELEDGSDPEAIRMLAWVAEDLAGSFPGDLGDRLQQAAHSLGGAADTPEAAARRSAVGRSHPMRVIAADVVARLQRSMRQHGLNLTFAPATLGCAIASMAAEMPDEMYRRWYARVMDADPAVGPFGPDDYRQLTTPEGTAEQGGIEAVMNDMDTLRRQGGDDGQAALDVLVTTATYARQHGLDIDDLPNAFRTLDDDSGQNEA